MIEIIICGNNMQENSVYNFDNNNSNTEPINNSNNNMIGGRDEAYDIRNYENGITRQKVKGGYHYFYIKNKHPIPKKDVDRINNLRLPPAWTNVWISANPTSSIQAIGIDVKGRKQYIYHAEHVKNAEKEKFLRLYNFIKAIPKLEHIMSVHKRLPTYHKFRVIVTMLSIVKDVHMRVGKEQYARENKSYGISSLRKKHMKIEGECVKFKFMGKSKQRLSYSLCDHELKAHLTLLLKLEGDRLFQHIDDEKVKIISDMDLNRYIQEYMGKEFTIKDFRTYAANFYFIKSILEETKKRSPKTQKIIKKNILLALKRTAFYLKHTRSISKKSYVMSFCVDLYQTNPDFFIERKNSNVDTVLLQLLKLYKQKVLHF
jgi:DNA topoisomerase-1